MIGGAAAVLTAWQQAIVAGAFELCLVGVMVIYELLGQGRAPIPAAAGAVGTTKHPTAATSLPAKRTANGRKAKAIVVAAEQAAQEKLAGVRRDISVGERRLEQLKGDIANTLAKFAVV
jgi:hypothetical protein